ncbi:hypothetical protein ACWKT3_41185 [Streptomyces violaceus]
MRPPRVLVLDEAQRLPGPALEFLRGLWDHPDTDTALVLAGAGSERALRRGPALASRVLTWELVPRLRPGEVAAAMAAFHPLWDEVAEDDVVWVDEHVGPAVTVKARGRAWPSAARWTLVLSPPRERPSA